MKILWITNFILISGTAERSGRILSGSWVRALLKHLSDDPDLEISVGMFSDKYRPPASENGINYYFIETGRQQFLFDVNRKIRRSVRTLFNEVSPDIVHLQGTEFPRELAVVDECRNRKIRLVASIQGLISVIADYYLAEVPASVWRRYSSVRDFLAGYTVPRQAVFCRRRGNAERRIIRGCDAVIGRTDWDRAHVGEIASGTVYYHYDELLREEFYREKWSLPANQAIIVGNMTMPLKGLHIVLRAMMLLKKEFPLLKLKIIGENLYEASKLKRKLIKKTYINYISCLIEELNLEDSIEWLGPCDASQIIDAMKNSSIYVQASSIENSPNSLAEALQIGMPVVASDAGGTMNMVEHSGNGFIYRAGDAPLMAYYVSKLLRSEELMLKFSNHSIARYKAKPFSGGKISGSLKRIYSGIIDG